MHELEHALRQSRFLERVRKALRAQRRLIRVLQHHRVAGHDRGHHRVHRGEIGVVPRRQHQYHTERLAANEAAEALLRACIEVGQCLRCDRHHVACTLFEAAHLAGRLADRPAHLPGDLLGDLLLAADERSYKARDDRGTLGERHVLPFRLRRARALQRAPDLRVRREWPLDVDPAVDRGDGFLGFGHISIKSSPRRTQGDAMEPRNQSGMSFK